MRNRFVLFADVLLIAFAAWGAFFLRFGWHFLPARPEFLTFLIVAVLVKISVFVAFGLYQRYWRYAAFWDLMAVAFANCAASMGVAAVMVVLCLVGVVGSLSRSVLPLDWLLALALTAGVRASVRVLAESMSLRAAPKSGPTRRVLIVGAGDAGALMVREMQKNPQLGMHAVGYLDDDPSKLGKRIYGIRVLGPLSALPVVTQQRRVDDVVIAIPTAGGATVRSVVEMCRVQGVPFRSMPGIFELLDGQLSVSRLREVDIADLLRRPQIHAEADAAVYLQDQTIIVTGAGGSIGSELCRQVAHSRPKLLVLLGHGENTIFQIASELRTRFPHVPVRSVIADVRDRERINKIFRAVHPDIVFHAAAHKHVTLMEENVCEAITNNVTGTRNVVDAALASGAPRLVLVSTDKAVAPTSVMGASKRVAEMIVREAARRSERAYMVVRFGNVLGSRGSVVPIFKEQIERGGPITVTHPDVRRYFMTIPEAVHLILRAGGIGRGSELFILDMGEPVLMRDLAADLIRLSGLSPDDIPLVYTGLRPGEKLNEVLCEEGSDVVSTLQPDVRLVREPIEMPADQLGDAIARLVDASSRDDRAKIIRLLGECIPSATLAVPHDSGPVLRSVDTGS